MGTTRFVLQPMQPRIKHTLVLVLGTRSGMGRLAHIVGGITLARNGPL